MAIWEIEGSTSNDSFKMKLCVTYDPDTSIAEQQVKLQLYIKCTSKQQRYRHVWNLTYTMDDRVVYSGDQTLPDSYYSGLDFGGKSYTYLEKNVWYAWGAPVVTTLINDDAKHSFNVAFTCGTKPANGNITVYGTAPRYTQKGKDPVNPQVVFDEDTNIARFSIDSFLAEPYWGITVSLYDERNVFLKTYTRTAFKGDPFVDETIPEDATRVTWFAFSISETDNYSNNVNGPELNIDRHSPFWVKVDDVWKKTKAWVKVDNVWKRVTQIHYRKD